MCTCRIYGVALPGTCGIERRTYSPQLTSLVVSQRRPGLLGFVAQPALKLYSTKLGVYYHWYFRRCSPAAQGYYEGRGIIATPPVHKDAGGLCPSDPRAIARIGAVHVQLEHAYSWVRLCGLEDAPKKTRPRRLRRSKTVRKATERAMGASVAPAIAPAGILRSKAREIQEAGQEHTTTFDSEPCLFGWRRRCQLGTDEVKKAEGNVELLALDESPTLVLIGNVDLVDVELPDGIADNE
ncbi:hypothetical protein C8J57DRAFT_1221461 [Mycena rebaudengoi]|nr:hypothetical protein C8J57DRAFT_1221461 [Mycena rebaudengoi]